MVQIFTLSARINFGESVTRRFIVSIFKTHFGKSFQAIIIPVPGAR